MNKGGDKQSSKEVSDDDIARIIGRDNMLRIKGGERPKHFDITNLWGDKPLPHAHGERPDTTREPLQGTMQARIPKETGIDPIGMGQPSHASTYECHEHDRMLRDYLSQVHRRGPNPHSSDGQHHGSPQAKCSHFTESPQTGSSTTGSNTERTIGSASPSSTMKGKLGSPTPSSPLSPLQQSFHQFGQRTMGSEDSSNNENIQQQQQGGGGESEGGSGPQIRRKQTIITPPSPMVSPKELLKSSSQQSQQQQSSDNNNNNNSQQQQQQQAQSSSRPPREQTKSPDVLNIMQTAL